MVTETPLVEGNHSALPYAENCWYRHGGTAHEKCCDWIKSFALKPSVPKEWRLFDSLCVLCVLCVRRLFVYHFYFHHI